MLEIIDMDSAQVQAAQSTSQVVDDLRTEQRLQKQALDNLGGQVTKISVTLENVAAQIGSAGKINWQMVSVILPTIALIVGIAWSNITTGIQVAQGPLNGRLESITESIHSINQTIGIMQTKEAQFEQRQFDGIADRKANEAEIRQHIVETDAFEAARDAIRNVNESKQQQINAMIWMQINPGKIFPLNNYYPSLTQNREENGFRK